MTTHLYKFSCSSINTVHFRISDIVTNPNGSTVKYTKKKDLEMFANLLISLTLGRDVGCVKQSQAGLKIYYIL